MQVVVNIVGLTLTRLSFLLETLKRVDLIYVCLQVFIQLDTDGNIKRCSVEPLNQRKDSSDFPVINPAFSGSRNNYIYAASSSGSRTTLPHFPFDTVVRLNLCSKSTHTWSVGNRRFIGEPIFVPKGDEEDDGYLLVVEVSSTVLITICNKTISSFLSFAAPASSAEVAS